MDVTEAAEPKIDGLRINHLWRKREKA